ncbi:MAG: hypothetical protein NUW24_11350 [Anaerolineae bacterium]|jgi:hypothetical protein|nr:hypothetical protein [Anaerolineae bacterium]MDH7474751.1 hypothetical protein [Anaerolineae bacterium]
MSGRKLMPDVRRDDELDRLIRWALYSMVANARPSPAVWGNLRLQLSRPLPTTIAPNCPAWRRSVQGLLTWTTGALDYIFDQKWDERFDRQRNSRRWRDYLFLAMPSAVAFMSVW